MAEHDVSVTKRADLAQSAPEVLRRLKESGQPAVLSINGQPGWTVRDATSYEALIAMAERAEEDDAIRESIEQMRQGLGVPVEEVLAEIQVIIDDARRRGPG